MTAGHPTPVPRGPALDRGDIVRVAVGGAAGATVRWAVVAAIAATASFPWPTLLVNVVGCFVVGLLFGARRSTAMLMGVGFAGGLTTFSTFALESARLLDRSEAPTAIAYIACSLVLGCLSVVAGRRVTP